MAAPAKASAQQGVRGVVVNSTTNDPIDHATVVLADTTGAVHGTSLSDSVGAFAVSAPAAGSYSLLVQRSGFARAQPHAVEVPRGGVVVVEIRLTPDPVMLEAVTVFGEAPRRLTPELEEFLSRRRMRIGYSFAREDFARLRAEHPVDLLREVPGFVTLGNRASYRWYALNFRRCPPAIFIDGRAVRISPTEVLEDLSLRDVYGVEVFRDWSGTPSQYASRCGSVVIWTRPPDQ